MYRMCDVFSQSFHAHALAPALCTNNIMVKYNGNIMAWWCNGGANTLTFLHHYCTRRRHRPDNETGNTLTFCR